MPAKYGVKIKIPSLTESLFCKKVLSELSFESRQSHSDPLFRNYNILKFFDMVQSQNILFMHKLLNNNIPSNLHNTSALFPSDFWACSQPSSSGLMTFSVVSPPRVMCGGCFELC